MALRQFTDLDTDIWIDRYSSGSAGDKVYSSNHTLDSTDGFYNVAITATIGTKTASVGLGDGTYNLPCKVVQSQGATANDTPNWEYNVLISVSGGVGTFKYNFTRSFYSGAQIITGNPYRTVTINNGVSVTIPAWNGSVGGEYVQFAAVKWDNSLGGNIALTNLGFRGGPDGNAPAGQGESWYGIGTWSHNANYSAGGGGDHDLNNYPWFASASGGGGGNATAGQNGYWIGGANISTNGYGGAACGNSSLTTMLFGGASGAGGQNGGNAGGYSANSAGNITILSRTIKGGIIYLNGTAGQGGSGNEGVGGSSAASCGLFKGQNIDMGSVSAVGGASYTHSYQGGGAGSNGRIHADVPVALKVTGASNPSVDIGIQHCLMDSAGVQVI